jgi:hypothetical protein
MVRYFAAIALLLTAFALLLVFFVVGSPPATPAEASGATAGDDDEYVLLSWNDLGMHCMSKDHSVFSILPPYNNLYAQLILRGDAANLPVVVTDNVTIEYSIPGNTYSAGKTDFWDWVEELFGVPLPPDVGLTGKGLAGELDPTGNHFVAEGIPITPFPDATPTIEDPYQQALVIARDAVGQELTTSTPVVPVSTEFSCTGCHHPTEQSILDEHDEVPGFDPNATPILCGSCHATPALGTPGVPEADYFSEVIHKKHEFLDNQLPGIDACYTCHPGVHARCLRGTMANDFGMICQDCHGGLHEVGESIGEGRIPWLMEPACRDCHTAQFGEPAGQLYRLSTGHGGIMCSGCHNSPHAILPTAEPRDNANVIALQGTPGTLSDCQVCHGTIPAAPGPHGIGSTAIEEVAAEVLAADLVMRVGPNPMRTRTRIEIEAGPGAEGRVMVFDVHGRTQAVFKPRRGAGGELWMDWDGTGRGGERVAGGTYFLRWENGLRSAAAKVLVLD